MKKLMLAVAMMAFCSSSFAYNYRWKVGSTAVHDGTTDGLVAQGTQAYIFNAQDYSQATLLKALFTDGSSVETITANKKIVALSANASSKFSTNSSSTSDIGKTYDIDGTAMADVYFAIFSDDGKSVFVSDSYPTELDWSAASATTTFSFTSSIVNDSKLSFEYAGATSFADHGGGWYSAGAVPEPTSGLLLLLGVAGLALRRRRA